MGCPFFFNKSAHAGMSCHLYWPLTFMSILLNIKLYYNYHIDFAWAKKWEHGQINQTENICTPYNHSIHQICFKYGWPITNSILETN